MTQFSHAQKVIFHGRFHDNGFLIVDGFIDEIKKVSDIETDSSTFKLFFSFFEISNNSINFLNKLIYIKEPEKQS